MAKNKPIPGEPISVRVIEIPKEGFLGKDQMAVLFGRSAQTIMIWVGKGILPPPCNGNDFFKDKLGPTVEKFWNADDVWKAHSRMVGGA